MLAGVDDLLALVASVYGDKQQPRAFRLLQGVKDVQRGEDIKAVAGKLNTTAGYLTPLAKASDPVAILCKTTLDGAADPGRVAARRENLGKLLLGALAERVFEKLYKQAFGAEELRLEDARPGHTDTDYRVFNGSDRPIFRLNIKFHGTLFQIAKGMVNLEPKDCFALATYKIHQGMEKQQKEVLPYVFAIVSVPGLTAEVVGASIPEELVHLSCLAFAAELSGRRKVEDAIVHHLIEHPQPEVVARAIEDYGARIEAVEWRVISARKADKLLRELLWERVFALTRRGYARTQVNMHFSLSGDLTSLAEFLRLWRERGPQGLASVLERGTV
jgi:hypothetical protein